MEGNHVIQAEKPVIKQSEDRKRPYLSVEQKLELSHMLRQEQDYNRMQMEQRESLVYGTLRRKKYGSSGKYKAPGMLQAAEEETMQEEAWKKEQRQTRTSFMIRSFLAVLLLTIVLLMRFENLSIAGIDYQNVIDSLQSREFINGIDFDELMSYTNE